MLMHAILSTDWINYRSPSYLWTNNIIVTNSFFSCSPSYILNATRISLTNHPASSRITVITHHSSHLLSYHWLQCQSFLQPLGKQPPHHPSLCDHPVSSRNGVISPYNLPANPHFNSYSSSVHPASNNLTTSSPSDTWRSRWEMAVSTL